MTFSAAIGLLADRFLGEPAVPGRLHPVALFGRATARVETVLYRDTRMAGLAYAAAGITTGIAVGRLVPTPIATWVAVSGRMLGSTALDIGTHLELGDLDADRKSVV